MKLYIYVIKYWLPVVILLGVIFWLSGGNFTAGRTSEFFFPIIKSLFPQLSPEDVTFVHELIRKFAHIVEYFFLGLLLSIAVFRSPLRMPDSKKIILVIILIFLASVADEIRQSFVALRKASLVDVGLDMIGGLMAVIIVKKTGD
jgi:VanZ family protein